MAGDRHEFRTHARTHVVLGLSLTLCAACTAQNPAPSRSSTAGEPVSAQQQAQLPFSCSGVLTRLPAGRNDNLDVVVTPYVCMVGNRPVLHEVDSNGKEWGRDELRLASHAAFRTRFHRFGPDLRARIARDGESVRQLADVWFPTPLAADRKMPPKPDFLALGKEQQKALRANYNSAISARGHQVASMIEKVAPDAIVRGDSMAFNNGGPLLEVEAAPVDLRAIGDQDGVEFVGLSLWPWEDKPASSSAWFDAGHFGTLQYYGIDGDGVGVTDVLGSYGVYDSQFLGLAGGGCNAPVGAAYECYCPAGAPYATAAWTAPPTSTPCKWGHQQHVMSIIKNTWAALSGGAARHAAMMTDNGNSACAGDFVDQINWAQQRSTVINRSAENSAGVSRYLDYVASETWPSIVASAGNSGGKVESHIHNGLVVGAVDDGGSSNRYWMTMAGFSSWQNTDFAELPHLVAPGVGIDTVSDYANGPNLRGCSGTSFSAPQVSGAIASLQEYYTPFQYWPEAVFPIMLVSAYTPGQPGGPDGTKLDLDDATDDHDGAGLLDAYGAWQVAQYYEVPGNAATAAGFYYDYSSSTTWSQGTETQHNNAAVYPGNWLRVAAFMMDHPTCGTPATTGNCSSDNFPLYYLHVHNTNPSANPRDYWSYGVGNNYKYVIFQNTESTTQTYEISLYMDYWDSMSWDTWGVAWDSN